MSDECLIDKIEMDTSEQRDLPVVMDSRSKAMLDVACRAAKSKASVLITGETGVGKEILAHYIHQHSDFAAGPFISVNCAAMPDNMIEAILFGYEKGAFTNAINSYAGKFEQAQNGTLLLDEISEIPLGLQAKLLRVLQEREVERLCGKKIIEVNVRVIAATNQDLKKLSDAGLFRKDLYYRLNVLSIHCPALRDRAEDILPLADYFIQQHAATIGKSPLALTEAAKQHLLNYSWPGNIRELDNVIQRALIMTDGNAIDVAALALEEQIETSEIMNIDADDAAIEQIDSKLKAHEAKMIIDVLKETHGSRDMAAKKLNISPRTLRYKIAKLKALGFNIP